MSEFVDGDTFDPKAAAAEAVAAERPKQASPLEIEKSFADSVKKAMQPIVNPEKTPETAPKQVAKTEEKPKAKADKKPLTLDFEPQAKVTDRAVEAEKPAESDKDYNWNRVKSERDAALAKVAEVEKMVADLKTKLDVVPKTYEEKLATTAKERDEIAQRLEQVAFERHPKFEATYIEPIKRLSERVKSLAPEVGDKLAKLVLQEGGASKFEEIDGLITDLPVSVQGRIHAVMNSAAELHESKLAALAKSREQYQLLQQEQMKQREAAIGSAQHEFDQVLGEASTAIEVFQSRDGDDEWNTEVEERKALAKHLFMGQSDGRELAKAAVWAASAPVYRQLLAQQMELNRRLQAQLKAVSGAGPKIDGGTGSGKGQEKPMDFVSAVKKIMSGVDN
jgi:hypothetical protein